MKMSSTEREHIEIEMMGITYCSNTASMAGITRLSFVAEIVAVCSTIDTTLKRLTFRIASSEYSAAGTIRSVSMIPKYEHLTILNIYTALREVLLRYRGF